MIETYVSAALAFLRLRKYKPAEQADSKSIIRQPESDHEIQGEVGVIYGASAKPALSAQAARWIEITKSGSNRRTRAKDSGAQLPPHKRREFALPAKMRSTNRDDSLPAHASR